MNHTFYSTNFHFHTYYRHKYKVTDARDGASMYFIARMKQGHCRIVTEDGELTVPQGNIFFIPLGLPYRSHWYGSDDIVFDSLGFYDFPEADLATYPLQLIPNNSRILSLIDQITADPQINSKTLSLFYTLLSEVLSVMVTQTGATASHQVIREATAYLARNPRAKISQVAKHCRVSESGLYNIFRRDANTTPNDLRHKILIENAVVLLQTTEASIEEISRQLEFSSSSYFRKVFFAHTEKTPRQVRKEARTL